MLDKFQVRDMDGDGDAAPPRGNSISPYDRALRLEQPPTAEPVPEWTRPAKKKRYSFSGSARAEISLKGQGFGAAPEVGSADALGS